MFNIISIVKVASLNTNQHTCYSQERHSIAGIALPNPQIDDPNIIASLLSAFNGVQEIPYINFEYCIKCLDGYFFDNTIYIYGRITITLDGIRTWSMLIYSGLMRNAVFLQIKIIYKL